LNSPEGQAKIKSKLYCKKHQDKTLKFYCETCKELSCTHCMVLTHIKQNHSCVSVEEVAEKHREILESSCATLDEKLFEGKKALNNISGVMKSLEENASATKEKIVEQAKIIVKVVSDQLVERTKEMCGEVDEIYDELHTELSRQHDEVKEYVDKVQ
ncbi:tripartite motif-containing 2-like, partial [Paramuricea clavata]